MGPFFTFPLHNPPIQSYLSIHPHSLSTFPFTNPPPYSHPPSLSIQESELERLTAARTAELKYLGEQNELEITKAKELSSIETNKFKNMVDSIGAETLASIATAGPDMQVWVCE